MGKEVGCFIPIDAAVSDLNDSFLNILKGDDYEDAVQYARDGDNGYPFFKW